MTTISDKTLDENVAAVDRGLRRVTASLIIDRDDAAMTRVLSIRETLATLVDQVKAELPRNDERKNLLLGLSIMHNNTASIIDLANEKELTVEAANEFVAKNQKRILKVSTLISSLREVAAKKSRASEETEIDSDGHTLQELVIMQDDAIRKYQPYRELLPKTNREVNKPFIIQRVPIQAKTKPFISPADFQKAGFNSTPIDEVYAVIENQMVLGLNVRKLREEKKDVKEYRKAIIKIISAKHHTKFIELSEMRPGLGNTGFVYSWIMEEKEYDRILKATHKRLNIVEWGFAFRA